MVPEDEFERIIESAPELTGLGAHAPDGFMVFVGADGSQARVSRIGFMEHTNAVADVLRDPAADLAGVVGPVAGLPPLARRVVLGTAYQHFKDWLLDGCPVEAVPFALFHVPAFVTFYRELTADAPEYSGDSFIEGVDHG